MKQNDVATLPANAGSNNAGPNAKTPVRAKIAPVESASTRAAATRMTTSPDGAAGGPDLLVPALENAPLPQGMATRKPAADLLCESAEECPAPAEKNKASTRAAATRMTTSPDGAAGGPDLLVPALENAPLPQGMATRKPAADLLCESAEECPAPAEKDKDGADHERAKHGMQARPQPSKRQLREREQQQKQAQEHEQEPDDPVLEPTATAWLLIDPNDPAGSGGGPRGKSGKRSKNKAGDASTERPDADWSDSDILMEAGDRLHRLAVVAHTFIQQLRPPKMNRSSALPALRPKSRAECERRCGSDGFCDPSAPLGCGGLHCGHQSDMLY